MVDKLELLSGNSYEAVRRSADPVDEEARRVRARAARGNLAAILVDQAGGLDVVAADGELVAAEFAELCDYLGLEPPDLPADDRAAGVCRRSACGNELALSGAVRHTSGSGGTGEQRGTARRKGFCSLRCMRSANLTPFQSGGER